MPTNNLETRIRNAEKELLSPAASVVIIVKDPYGGADIIVRAHR